MLSNRVKASVCKKDIEKQKKLKGEAYEGYRGIIHAARPMLPSPCTERPTHKCILLVSEEKRKEIYASFRSIQSTDEQIQFLQSHIQQKLKKRTTRHLTTSRRINTNDYLLTVDGKKVTVCREFFMATLNVTDATIRSALKRYSSTGVFLKDRRGKHPPKNKLKADDDYFLRQHITSFPVYHIHNKKPAQRKFLDSSLNISMMHRMYREMCINQGRIPVSLEKYRRVFSEYNLAFCKTNKSTCKNAQTD